MVWQEDSPVIVMITKLKEKNEVWQLAKLRNYSYGCISRRDFRQYGRKLADNWFLTNLLIRYVRNGERVAKYIKCNSIAIVRHHVLQKRVHFLDLCCWVPNFLRNTSFICCSPLYFVFTFWYLKIRWLILWLAFFFFFTWLKFALCYNVRDLIHFQCYKSSGPSQKYILGSQMPTPQRNLEWK